MKVCIVSWAVFPISSVVWVKLMVLYVVRSTSADMHVAKIVAWMMLVFRFFE